MTGLRHGVGMRAALVLALLLVGTVAVIAVPAPAAASSSCALDPRAPVEDQVDCIQQNLRPCHFAYPHPCY
ncbi:MAG: hypothetical protein V4510_06745 [bacterium]